MSKEEKGDIRKGTRSLVTALIDVSSGSIVSSKHGDDTVRVTVGTGNVRSLGSNVVNVQSNTARSLGNHGTSLQGIVDSLNRVVLHGDQEARGQLGVGSTGVEQGGRGVGEVSLGHEVVRLDDFLDVSAVDTDSDSHNHMLRSFGDPAVDSEQV